MRTFAPKFMNDTETPASHKSLPTKQRRVLLVDDHPAIRRGIAALIGDEPDLTICGDASTAPAALEAMRQLNPDLAVIDISMPGTNGVELIKLMLAERPNLQILMLSMHDESIYALRALRAGAKGYVMKGEALECLLAGLRKVGDGEIYVSPKLGDRLIFKAIQSSAAGVASPVDKLSDRELEVLRLLGKGFGTRKIAEELSLSVKTVETHRAHIKDKLGFKEAGEMVRFAIDWGIQEKTQDEVAA